MGDNKEDFFGFVWGGVPGGEPADEGSLGGQVGGQFQPGRKGQCPQGGLFAQETTEHLR